MDISREGTYRLKLGLFKPRCTSSILEGVLDWPLYSQREREKLTLDNLVIEALSEAWSTSVEEIIEVSEFANYYGITIGKHSRGGAIKLPADRIMNPNCFE
jgi:hypothetical protein